MQGSDHPSGHSHHFPAFSRLFPPISADFLLFWVKCKAPIIPQAKSRPEEPFLARRNHTKRNRFHPICHSEVFLTAFLHKSTLGIWGVSDQSKVPLSWFLRCVCGVFCSHGRCWLLGTTRTSLWRSLGRAIPIFAHYSRLLKSEVPAEPMLRGETSMSKRSRWGVPAEVALVKSTMKIDFEEILGENHRSIFFELFELFFCLFLPDSDRRVCFCPRWRLRFGRSHTGGSFVPQKTARKFRGVSFLR